jgi:hypothetical protein
MTNAKAPEMTMGFDEESPPTLTMHNDGKDTFVVVNGVTIAKRPWHSPSRDVDIVGARMDRWLQ